jgi:hypothetical protein
MKNLENVQSHLQSPASRESMARPCRSFLTFWLVLFTLVALASSARANYILGTTNCSCTNFTVLLAEIPQGPIVADLGGVLLDGTYDFASQTITAIRPAGFGAGVYLLTLAKDNVILTSANITLCDCNTNSCGCPAGPVGPRGATGPQGKQGVKGDTGATGPRGLRGGETGPQGPRGLAGPAGARGLTGPQGAQGVKGATGPAGIAGINGTNGANGAPGINGTNGATGATGPAGGSGGSSQYGYIYNLNAQVVPLETAVIFSSTGVHSAGITHGLGSSDIIVVNKGDYTVTYSVSGTEPNQFALFLNGVAVAGTVYGSGAGTQQNTGQAILSIGANDVLTLRNHTSAAAVTLAATPPIGGTVAAVNASILLLKLN